MPLGWVAGATLAAGAIGAIGSASAASDQADASRNAQNISQQQYQDTVNRNAPFTQSGYGALSQLNYLLGVSPQDAQGNPVSSGGSSGGNGTDPSSGYHIGAGGGISQLIPYSGNHASTGYGSIGQNGMSLGSDSSAPARIRPCGWCCWFRCLCWSSGRRILWWIWKPAKAVRHERLAAALSRLQLPEAAGHARGIERCCIRSGCAFRFCVQGSDRLQPERSQHQLQQRVQPVPDAAGQYLQPPVRYCAARSVLSQQHRPAGNSSGRTGGAERHQHRHCPGGAEPWASRTHLAEQLKAQPLGCSTAAVEAMRRLGIRRTRVTSRTSARG
jgi:hypothetical protein